VNPSLRVVGAERSGTVAFADRNKIQSQQQNRRNGSSFCIVLYVEASGTVKLVRSTFTLGGSSSFLPAENDLERSKIV
jgi:hypothetical protein